MRAFKQASPIEVPVLVIGTWVRDWCEEEGWAVEESLNVYVGLVGSPACSSE